MDDCIEAQWGLYIGYMRKTLEYNITIIPLTIIPLIPPPLSLQLQRECNDAAFEEFTKHTQLKQNWYIRSPKQRCCRSQQLLNVDEEDLLHKRVLPSRIVLEQIPKSSWISTSTLQMRTLLWRDNNR
jgi:hypothetical protein